MGTPHSSDFWIKGKKFALKSDTFANFKSNSACLSNKNNVCAGNSFDLQSVAIEGHMVCLNSVVVKNLSFWSKWKRLVNTPTESAGSFKTSHRDGTTFLTSVFFSNLSRIFVMLFRNWIFYA